MSKITKRKHVMKETVWDDYELPKENQTIVKILKSKGNNLHQITTPNGEEYLVSMPMKFRKNIWVKRGDYILVEPILEGDKVKAEIVKVLNKDSIKYYKQNQIWPKEFEEDSKKESNIDIYRNPNDRDNCSDSDSDSDNTDYSDSESDGDKEKK